MRTKSEILLFAFCFVFLLIKIYSIYTTNFNLFGDEAQYWLWSQALDFGYYSKPPLLAWFLHGHTSIFGSSFISLGTNFDEIEIMKIVKYKVKPIGTRTTIPVIK